MTRNLKALGLTLVAAMALGAIGAQGASAVNHEFKSSAAETVLTGHAESGTHKFTATAGVFTECTNATFEGENNGFTRNTVTVHPTYSSCNLSGGAESNVVVDTGGCNFVFGSDTEASAAHFSAQEHARTGLECEGAHSASPHVIEITAPGCRIAFEETHANSVEVNQSLLGVNYTNVESHGSHSKKAITVNATVRTIRYTVTSGSFCGLIGHAAGTYSSGSYDGKASVTGYEKGTPTGSTTNGFSWNHGTQTNIWIE